jgi:hypothetical protein
MKKSNQTNSGWASELITKRIAELGIGAGKL